MKFYKVGGCVRDTFMNAYAKDVDWVVVGSSEQEMLDMGYKKVGADFPVFLHPVTGEEHALARTEKKSGNGYHGFTVETEGVSLEDDLRRRDLTVNAMAMADGVLYDPFNGERDLRDGVLRHVDDEGFKEDPVRVLRLARFLSRWTDFVVHKTTVKLCREMVAAGELAHLTPERVSAEMVKALGEKRPSRFFVFLQMVGALEVVFPEVHRLVGVPAGSYEHHPEGDSFTHTMMVLDEATKASHHPLTRYCALVHDLGKGTTPADVLPHHYGHEARGYFIARDMADRLKMPSEWRHASAVVAKYHTHVHNFHLLKGTTIADMVDDLQLPKCPGLAEILPTVSMCDSRGRSSFYSDRDYPNAETAKTVIRAVSKVKLSDVVEDPAEIEAMPINRRKDVLHRAKADAANIHRKKHV
jgi:tRNA nucleotidyltransferase (CCA-adding enzyme)